MRKPSKKVYLALYVSLAFFALTIGYIVLGPRTGHGDPKYTRYAVSNLEIVQISEAVDSFHADVGQDLTTAEGLRALLECPESVPNNLWHGPYLGKSGLYDPWRHEFHYTYTPERPHGLTYEIISAGMDGIYETKDDIKNYA